MWSHRIIYVKPLRCLTHTLNTHVFFCTNAHAPTWSDRARPCKLHAKQAPTNWQAPWWGRGIWWGAQNSSFQMPGRKISCYKDTSGSSSCQNTDSVSFSAVWILQAKTNENHVPPPPKKKTPKKKCIAKRWSEQSFMPICYQHPLQFIIFCVCEGMWVLCVSLLVYVYFCTSLLMIFHPPPSLYAYSVCTLVCVCAVYDTLKRKKKKKIALKKLWSIDDCLQAAFINISI